MLISFESIEDASQSSVRQAAGYIGALLIENVNASDLAYIAQSTEQSFWAYASSPDQVVELCNAGIEKVVVQPDLAKQLQDSITASRLAIAVPADLADPLTLPKASAYIVSVPANAEQSTLLKSLVETKGKELLSEGGEQSIYVKTNDVTLQHITALKSMGVRTVLPAASLTTAWGADQRQGKINVAEALLAGTASDRADGLIATIVVDERNVALGLVYSSLHSVSESIRMGEGVYQSRSRGLWHKGATSGATQTLRRIDLDCDNDTMRFVVQQHGKGFCHLDTRTCFGNDQGLNALEATLQSRKANAPEGSYTARLFNDDALLRSKIMEEAEELCDATEKNDVAWEAADLIYFALTKCVKAGVSLKDIERNLDLKALKVTRRPGNAKPKWTEPVAAKPEQPVSDRIEMQKYALDSIDAKVRSQLLLRPIIDSTEIIGRVTPIMKEVRTRGDAALLDLTAKFDRVQLSTPTIKAPFPESMMQVDEKTRAAIDQAYENIFKFHDAQMDRTPLVVETMPGVVCSRFARPIERVGLYVPGGTAVLPSTTLMLGVPAKVAGCKEIVVATPPRPDGSAVPEVIYVAHKIGASHVILAGGAQAVAAMAYGTETVPKVDKICGPGNQYVTAAKMAAQNDTSCLVSIDMPAGPSEVLVIADKTCTPAYVAADLLSQAEHGVDSQVVLVAVDLSDEMLQNIDVEIHNQASRLPRVDIVRQSIPKSYTLKVSTMDEAVQFSNDYAPEHLILHMDKAEELVPHIMNAGSVFVGPYSPESCGDYASGTNHTLPTYGYSRMYSGVNTLTFVKHITSQQLTADGLNRLGDTVERLAEIEGLEAHRNAVAIRLADLRK